MTDDLVKRLQSKYASPQDAAEAAERIEALERALRNILKVPNSETAYSIMRMFAYAELSKVKDE